MEGVTASMFNTNINVFDTRYTVVSEQRQPMDVLHKRVAPNAILNAGGRADEVRCHPGTREEIINRVERWRGSQGGQTAPIFWLSGPAGVGKSAIMQTIAERCKEQNAPQANFFFFRADPSRSNLAPLVATLVHQITRLYPPLQDVVGQVLFKNRLILDAPLEEQLMQLIVAPLQAIRHSPYLMPLLIVDGLDECHSEHSQQEILRAFDKILAEHPGLFCLLVASRDEPQIRHAFNNTSSPLFPIYLDDQYQPEKDIRVFVIDQFKQVQMTHPLAGTLPATWPLMEDIEYIVRESSGQLLYAATVMRFIDNSLASPQLSLDRVKGAAQMATKSPFSNLDAIYTYILSQVDNQEALKVILHSHLFLHTYKESPSLGIILRLLEAYKAEYNDEVVLSCMADLAPMARVTHDRKVLFYHASFPDYLADLARSGDYFFDIYAFDFRIQCSVWKARGTGVITAGFHRLSLEGLFRLSSLPSGFLDTLIQLREAAFVDENGTRLIPFDIFTHLHHLCNRTDDITKYKRMVHQWAEDCVVDHQSADFWRQQDAGILPPYVLRSIFMSEIKARINAAVSTSESHGLHDIDLHHLIPESTTDVADIIACLSTLLRHIYKEKHRTSISEYNQLIKSWTAWAVRSNIIPLNEEDLRLPNVRWYYTMANIERDVTNNCVLGPREDDCDVPETAAWITSLLCTIYRQKYHASTLEYNRLVQKWTAWAVQNDIPLRGIDNLPNARWYCAMANIEHDVTNNVALAQEEGCNVPEVAAWLTTLLRRIYSEKYFNSIGVYNQLVRKWTLWANQNGIPLNGVDNLPNTLWYRTIADIDHDITTDSFLTPEEDCDVSETSTWLMSLLCRIYTEKYYRSVKEYNQLIRKWTAWAVHNDIPLNVLNDLPNAQWYHTMAKLERDVTADIALRREKDCDVPETTAWLTALLHRIHEEKYLDSIEDYDQLLQKWTSWATWNDIPLEGVDSLPHIQHYLLRSRIHKWLADYLGLGGGPK